MKKFTAYRVNSYKSGAEKILQLLQKIPANNLSERHIVIVPDRASMSAEQLILDNLGGSFNVEVRTLRQYANEISANVTEKYLSKQAGIMVLTKIIFDNSDNLVCYKKGIHNNGFVEGVYEIISQLMYSQIPSAQIALDKLPPVLTKKMQDIKLIYSQYEQYLAQGYVDSAMRLERLIVAIKDSDKVKNSYFYFYDFESLTKQEQNIILNLAQYSLGVSLAYCYSANPRNAYLYLDELNQAVISIADLLGEDATIINTPTVYANDFTRQIGENLFSYRKNLPLKVSPETLTLCQVPTVNAEVECLAQDISKFVRAGNRYKDYFVICSDVSKYRLAVERIFNDYNIPYFTDTQIKLSQHPLSQYLVDYLTMCRNNYKQDSVLCFVKNYYFSTSPDVYVFENYCLKYNAGYKLDKFELGKTDETINFASADNVRAQLYALCEKYKIEDTSTTAEKISILKQLLEQEKTQEKSLQLEALCDKMGQSQFSAATRQVYAKLNDILTQYENILGETVLSADDFIRILQAGISSANISVLPPRNDCVVLANMAKSKKHDIVALGLLGAIDNAMPIVKKDTKLLTDKNLDILSHYRLNVQGKMATENKLEKLSLYLLLHEPRKLFVSCCEKQSADALGETLLPSEFFKTLPSLFTVDGGKYPVHKTVPTDRVYTDNSAIAKLADCVRKEKDFVFIANPNYKLLKDNFEADLLPFSAEDKPAEWLSNGAQLFKTVAPTTVSKIETFFQCPARHYFRYGIKLTPREVAELNVQDFGNILHEVLQYYITDISKEESDEVTRKRAKNCFDRVAAKDYYSGIMNDPQQKSIVNLLKRESTALCLAVKKQLQNSDFVNHKAELKFGSNKVKAIEIKGEQTTVKLIGTIDRVDVCDDKFIIIDYKSGSSGAVYDENTLYVGKKLQLLIYLTAMQENLEKKPVGFYYMRLHNKFVKEGLPRYAFHGRTLADNEVIGQIDNTFRQTQKSKLLSVTLNKDGTYNKYSRVLNEEQLSAQAEYAKQSVLRADALISKGYVAQTPLEPDELCSYCDYKDICCANDLYPGVGRSIPSNVTAETINQIILSQKEGKTNE